MQYNYEGRALMSTVNLEEQPFILDYKKKAVFLHNLLSNLPGPQNQANREAIMHFAQNLSSNIQQYDEFVAAVSRSYQGPQLSEAGSKFNANTILNAIPEANATTKEITAENLNAAYDKARLFFAADTHVTPITNAVIEAEKPKYLDFDKYKQDYLSRVNMLVTLNMPLQLTGLSPDIVKEAQTGLDGITDYKQWTDKFNEQLMTAIQKNNPDNLLGYLTPEQLTIQSSLPFAQNMAYQASLTTTPPKQPEVQQQPEQQPEQSAHQEPQQPQYDTYSPNTKDHVERIKKWMEHIGLGDKAQELIDKYGVELAHSIVQNSLMRPKDMTNATDGKFKSSKKTIEYFINNDVSADKLAQIPGVDESFVNLSLASRPNAKRLEFPEPIEPTISTLNIEPIKIDPSSISFFDKDQRPAYVAYLKKELLKKGVKVDGEKLTEEQISQALDKALRETMESNVKDDFNTDGTKGQWAGVLRHKFWENMGVANDTDRTYDYIAEIEKDAMKFARTASTIRSQDYTQYIAEVKGIIDSYPPQPAIKSVDGVDLAAAEIPTGENPEVPTGENPEVPTGENPAVPTVEGEAVSVTVQHHGPTLESDNTELVTVMNDQRADSGVDEEIATPTIPVTWQEIAAATIPTPPANWAEFKRVAREEFKRTEGDILQPYFDKYGHPTISTGILIYRRNEVRQSGTRLAGTSLADKQDEIATATNIINDKNAYYMQNGKKVPLYSNANDNTPNITSIKGTVTIVDSKGNNVVLERIPNAGAKIKSVNGTAIGSISQAESTKVFETRLKNDYLMLCKAIPNFKDMPTNVQIAAVHMCFGMPSTFHAPKKGVNDFNDRCAKFGLPFKYGEERTPEELMTYVNKYYEGRDITQGRRNTLALANAEVEQINNQLMLANQIDNHENSHENEQTLVTQINGPYRFDWAHPNGNNGRT